MVDSNRQPFSTRHRSGHVNGNGMGGDQPLQPPGRVMTQQRPRPAGENSRKALSPEREVGVADGKEPSIEPMRAPRHNRLGDRSLGVAMQALQLTNRDDPMLATRKSGDLAAARQSFQPHKD